MKALSITIVTILSMLALSATAFAHADLVSSTPGANVTVTAAPGNVVLNFSEEIATGSTAAVTMQGGTAVSTAATITGADHKQLTVALQPGLMVGTYAVSWHAIAKDDGDASDGTFYFTFANAAGGANPASAPAPAPVKAPAGMPSTSTASTEGPAALALLALALTLGAVSLRSLLRQGGRA